LAIGAAENPEPRTRKLVTLTPDMYGEVTPVDL